MHIIKNSELFFILRTIKITNLYVASEFVTNINLCIFALLNCSLFVKFLVIFMYYYYNQDRNYHNLILYKSLFNYNHAENFILIMIYHRIFIFFILIFLQNYYNLLFLSFTIPLYYFYKLIV
jgi:hypothetical protein